MNEEKLRKRDRGRMLTLVGLRMWGEQELARELNMEPEDVQSIVEESPDLFHTTEDLNGSRFYIRRRTAKDPQVHMTTCLMPCCLRCGFELGHDCLGNEQSRRVACPKCQLGMMVYARVDGYRVTEAAPITPVATPARPLGLQQVSLGDFGALPVGA